MQQENILAQDIVMLMLISQAVMIATMYRNGRSEVLSGACLESSSNNSNNELMIITIVTIIFITLSSS